MVRFGAFQPVRFGGNPASCFGQKWLTNDVLAYSTYIAAAENVSNGQIQHQMMSLIVIETFDIVLLRIITKI